MSEEKKSGKGLSIRIGSLVDIGFFVLVIVVLVVLFVMLEGGV